MTLAVLSNWITVFGIPGLAAAGGVGAWRAAVLSNRRETSRDRLAADAEERAQAELLSAHTEPAEDGSFLVVKNGSSLLIPSCIAIYRTYIGDAPEFGSVGPFPIGSHDVGAIGPGETVRVYIPNADGVWESVKRPAYVTITDVAGRRWLRDRSAHLHRLPVDGAIPRGTDSELDRWEDENPVMPGPVVSE